MKLAERSVYVVGKSVNEFRVVGPPGTGKTTWLCRQAEAVLRKYGGGTADDSGGAASAWDEPPDTGASANGRSPLLFASLTRAAAAELRSRGVKVSPEAIGTLHSHAWRALDRPPLCVDGKPIEEFNAVCKTAHRLPVRSRRAAPDQGTAGQGASDIDTPGEVLLEAYHLNRSRLLDRRLWTTRVTAFAEEYETWKRVAGYIDFSDVIHDAYDRCPCAPGNPHVIFIDEAQDHDAAELRLIRSWAEHADKVVIVGDPDQAIFEWRGADPRGFYSTEIPQENYRLLEQSYRVPRAVHRAAVAMIERIQTAKKSDSPNGRGPHLQRDETDSVDPSYKGATGRVPVSYLPRDADGSVRRLDWPMHGDRASYVMADAMPAIQAGRRVMFLASCEYMLAGLIAELRAAGIPYWNPYAPERGRFNPMHPSRGQRTADVVLNFLRPSPTVYGAEARGWTWAELWSWIAVIDGRDWLIRGAKTKLEERADKQGDQPADLDQLAALCKGGTLPPMVWESDPKFLASACGPQRQKIMEFCCRVFARSGRAGLTAEPNVFIGTIHSVKGGEADVVYLCPDLSYNGYEGYDAHPDPTWRLFYVAMTRAREDLVLCEPSSDRSIEW